MVLSLAGEVSLKVKRKGKIERDVAHDQKDDQWMVYLCLGDKIDILMKEKCISGCRPGTVHGSQMSSLEWYYHPGPCDSISMKVL